MIIVQRRDLHAILDAVHQGVDHLLAAPRRLVPVGLLGLLII